MKYPCQDPLDRYLWESDNPADRLDAVARCQTCPILAACHRQTEADYAKGLKFLGVAGGVDYSSNSVTAGAVRNCIHCGALIVGKKTGRPRRFCGRDCYDKWRWLNSSKSEARDCELCGATFHKHGLSHRQWAGRRFCSLSCARKADAAKRLAA